MRLARLVAGLIVGVGSLVGFDTVGGPDAATSSVSQVAVDEQGGGPSAYVTNVFSNSVSVIDVATNTVVAIVPVGITPNGVAITPDGTSAYVANVRSASVSVIDVATNTVLDHSPRGHWPA